MSRLNAGGEREACARGSKTPRPKSRESEPKRAARLNYRRDVQISSLLGERLHTKPTLAKLSLARMIAATVLRMWKDEEEYDPGRAGPPTEIREG